MPQLVFVLKLDFILSYNCTFLQITIHYNVETCRFCKAAFRIVLLWKALYQYTWMNELTCFLEIDLDTFHQLTLILKVPRYICDLSVWRRLLATRCIHFKGNHFSGWGRSAALRTSKNKPSHGQADATKKPPCVFFHEVLYFDRNRRNGYL